MNILIIITPQNVSVFRVLLVRIFPHSDWIMRDTDHLSVLFLRIQSECGEIQTRVTTNMDTFCTLNNCESLLISLFASFKFIPIALISLRDHCQNVCINFHQTKCKPANFIQTKTRRCHFSAPKLGRLSMYIGGIPFLVSNGDVVLKWDLYMVYVM